MLYSNYIFIRGDQNVYNSIKKHKFVAIAVLVDLFIFWLLFYSGFIIPFINPSLEQYQRSGTSFPRNYNQTLIWILLHTPTSFLIDPIVGSIANKVRYANALYAFASFQTGILAYFLNKYYKQRKAQS